MNCPNRTEWDDPEWICLCESKLDGSFVNGLLPERLRRRALAPGEDRQKVIAELESLANDALCLWKQTT